MKFYLLPLLLFSLGISAQKTANIKVVNGTNHPDLRNIMSFENLYIDKVQLESRNLIGHQYVVLLKEFRDGKLITTTELFESTSINYPIASKSFEFTILSKVIDQSQLKIALKFNHYGSKTFYFDLFKETKFGYIMKNFYGAKETAEIELDKEFYITAILSPTMHADGGASYCEVVAGDDPQQLGVKFNIPHYFLISMKIL